MYDVVYADPAWRYRNIRTGGSHTSGAAQKYPTMALDEIMAMPVGSIVARDSLCFLWATTPMGDDPFKVLRAWGFTFKTKWYWNKVGRKGTGYWTRGEVEELLIGVRGNVKAWRSSLSNFLDGVEFSTEEITYTSKPEGHSRKPAAVRDRITRLTPGCRRVELFATERPEGWDAFGLALDPLHNFRDHAFWAGFHGQRREGPPVQEASGRSSAAE